MPARVRLSLMVVGSIALVAIVLVVVLSRTQASDEPPWPGDTAAPPAFAAFEASLDDELRRLREAVRLLDQCFAGPRRKTG